MNIPNPLAWRADSLRDDEQIEQRIRLATNSGDPSLSEISAYSTKTPAPRHRARLAATAALLCSSAEPQVEGSLDPAVIDIAASVELVHIGMRYHDDVIGEIRTRGGQPTANSIWGDLESILAGDFLIARASEIASSHGTEVASELATTIGWLCEGRNRELGALGTAITADDRLSTMSLATAALFSTGARMSGLLLDVDRSSVDALSAIGHNIGMAFAINADIDRFSHGDPLTGATPTDDIRRGFLTLPALLADDVAINDIDVADDGSIDRLYADLANSDAVSAATELRDASIDTAITDLATLGTESANLLAQALTATLSL